MFRRCIIAGLALFLARAESYAQTSAYSSMTVAGEWQGWKEYANNLYLISNQVWEGVFFISQRATNNFKFVANGNWTTNWGGASITGSVPLSGVANVVNGGNIGITNLTDGFYRFRFNESNKIFWVDLVSYAYQGPGSGNNLIRNGDFELPDAVNTNHAYSWSYRSAMTYGDHYGNSGRVDWRYHSPFYQYYIGQTFGGLWQDVPVGEDLDYELSAWFWMDGSSNTNFGPWTAAVQQVKFEFYNASHDQLSTVFSTNIPVVGDQWMQTTLRASAPTGAAWARAVINVGSAGNKGSLQLDDVAMRVVPRPYQYFSAWKFANTGAMARGGWYANGASVVTNIDLAYSSPSLALTNGGFIRSPYLEGGINRIAFRYRNGSQSDEEPTDNLTVEVRVSPTGTGDTFQTVSTLAGIIQQSYVSYSVTVPSFGEDQRVLEIRATAGTNQFLIDNIEILPNLQDQRSQNFSTWTNSYYLTNGCFSLDGWQLCTGRVFNTGAFQAPSALLPGRSNSFNYLQSPLLTNGYGSISLELARGATGSASAELWLQESANGVTWTTIQVVAPISDTTWTYNNSFFYQPQARYIRFVNASTGTPVGGGSTLLVNEGFDDGLNPPAGWTFTGISGVYSSSSNYGQSPPSLKFDTAGDIIETPTLVSPTNVQFWMKGQGLIGSYQFDIQGFITGSWVTVQSYTAIASGTYNVPITSAATRVRFVYTLKASGNVSFDDVVIRGVSAGNQPPQDLLVDNINIGLPEEFRAQDFNAWPTKNYFSSGVDIFQGWVITNAIVHSEYGYDSSQSLRLSTDLNNFIRSPVFPDGIGLISFQYAKWPSDTTPVNAVQYSTNNGVSWITITNLSMANSATSYQKFEYLLNVSSPASFRLLHTSGSGRTMIDDISIGLPQPPADVSLTAYHEPTAPYTNDTVSIKAVVSPVYGAVVSDVTSFYRVGTNGGFATLPMAVTNFTVYQSSSSIGPYTTGTLVQYFTRVQFTGPGSAGTSPRYFPAAGSNGPAFFVIPRSKSGQVWINEVKYVEWLGFDQQFIEIAGPTGFNISGWSIELYRSNGDGPGTLFDKYVIPSVTILPPDTPSIGFWVLGQDGVDNYNMLLTNSLWDYLPLGIRLLNEGGGVEQALCFAGNIPNYKRVYPPDAPFDYTIGLSLVGAGTNYDGFGWTNDVPLTPGAINYGQTYGTGLTEPPDAWISRLIWGTNITVVTVGNTNSWVVSPWYTTAITNGATWTAVTPFNSSYASGTNTIWFDRPNMTNYYLRIRFDAP